MKKKHSFIFCRQRWRTFSPKGCFVQRDILPTTGQEFIALHLTIYWFLSPFITLIKNSRSLSSFVRFIWKQIFDTENWWWLVTGRRLLYSDKQVTDQGKLSVPGTTQYHWAPTSLGRFVFCCYNIGGLFKTDFSGTQYGIW